MEARARLQHVADRDAYEERDGRDDFEIDEGAESNHADAAHVAHLGDADGDGDEDDDGNDGTDQADEGVAQGLQFYAQGRVHLADNDAERDADQNLDIELLEHRHRPPPVQFCRIFTTTLIASSTRSRA